MKRVRQQKKVLSDDQKHEIAQQPEEYDQQSTLGSESNPEEEKNSLDEVQEDFDMYTQSQENDDGEPAELNVAQEVDKAERKHVRND